MHCIKHAWFLIAATELSLLYFPSSKPWLYTLNVRKTNIIKYYYILRTTLGDWRCTDELKPLCICRLLSCHGDGSWMTTVLKCVWNKFSMRCCWKLPRTLSYTVLLKLFSGSPMNIRTFSEGTPNISWRVWRHGWRARSVLVALKN